MSVVRWLEDSLAVELRMPSPPSSRPSPIPRPDNSLQVHGAVERSLTVDVRKRRHAFVVSDI